MATTLYKDAFNEYIDADFKFEKHPSTAGLFVKKGKNSVRQSVFNLMQLRRGDKPFHPEIESPLYPFLFETASPLLEVIVQDEVRKYLARYEPRVEIISVTVRFPNTNSMSCHIIGTIIEIQEEFSVNILVDRLR